MRQPALREHAGAQNRRCSRGRQRIRLRLSLRWNGFGRHGSLASPCSAITSSKRSRTRCRRVRWGATSPIRLSCSQLDQARAAFIRAAELGWDSTFGLALVRYCAGDADGALRQLAQCIDEEGYSCRARPGASLVHLCMVKENGYIKFGVTRLRGPR